MNEYIFTLGDPLFNEETREAVFRPEVIGRLIRCRDCKHWHPSDYCTERDGLWYENDYCSYGEREDDETD